MKSLNKNPEGCRGRFVFLFSGLCIGPGNAMPSTRLQVSEPKRSAKRGYPTKSYTLGIASTIQQSRSCGRVTSESAVEDGLG